ncbi:hypothetical protein M5K25_003722 [Dendrobium thyrsiflorum]|uniref:CCHC-type domain-containing protein n=1 Tax=Dendrobium thyrsiflorum TaxID=117978 RepID=A0ABD0VKY8_DENTH
MIHDVLHQCLDLGLTGLLRSVTLAYERNCYMCGAPDHLIRECPHAKTGNVVVSGGISPYQEGYWHGASFTNVRPYANIYGSPPMMPFDPMMFQALAFGISYVWSPASTLIC